MSGIGRLLRPPCAKLGMSIMLLAESLRSGLIKYMGDAFHLVFLTHRSLPMLRVSYHFSVFGGLIVWRQWVIYYKRKDSWSRLWKCRQWTISSIFDLCFRTVDCVHFYCIRQLSSSLFSTCLNSLENWLGLGADSIYARRIWFRFSFSSGSFETAGSPFLFSFPVTAIFVFSLFASCALETSRVDEVVYFR